jgi:hypothetical protein
MLPPTKSNLVSTISEESAYPARSELQEFDQSCRRAREAPGDPEDPGDPVGPSDPQGNWLDRLHLAHHCRAAPAVHVARIPPAGPEAPPRHAALPDRALQDLPSAPGVQGCPADLPDQGGQKVQADRVAPGLLWEQQCRPPHARRWNRPPTADCLQSQRCWISLYQADPECPLILRSLSAMPRFRLKLQSRARGCSPRRRVAPQPPLTWHKTHYRAKTAEKQSAQDWQ